MKKIYYLQTCDTCKRILRQLNLEGVELQEIKSKPITVTQLDQMRKLTSSYESLFSKRAKLYKEMDLKNQQLDEVDYKKFILDHYTFLKRPVAIINDTIYIGNSKKVVEALVLALD